MKLFFIIIFLVAIQLSGYAQQPPWNAKFIMYHPDGYTDTLWVGCDENATDGFDEGLDSLDNSFEYPISIGAYSPEVDAEFGLDNCVNLKRNIRPFGYPTEFTFYIVHDELETVEYAMIGWDTLEFKYLSYDSLLLQECVIQAQSGYILLIDNTIHYVALYNEHIDTSYYIFPQDSIALFPESSLLACTPFDFVLKLKLEVYFKDNSLDVSNLNINNQISIFPNPVKENLNISNNLHEEVTISLYDLIGTKILSKQIYPFQTVMLDVHALTPSSYILFAINQTEQIIFSQILVKL